MLVGWGDAIFWSGLHFEVSRDLNPRINNTHRLVWFWGRLFSFFFFFVRLTLHFSVYGETWHVECVFLTLVSSTVGPGAYQIMHVPLCGVLGSSLALKWLKLNISQFKHFSLHTHIHTHTHTYIYIYIYIYESRLKSLVTDMKLLTEFWHEILILIDLLQLYQVHWQKRLYWKIQHFINVSII